MSTTNKLLKTAGVAIGLDVVGAVGLLLEKNDFDVNEFTKDFGIKAFTAGFVINLFISTLPALGVFGIDKFVNQNITSNKTIQYGLTVAESFLILPTVPSVCRQKNEFTEYFKELVSPSLKPNELLKIFAINIIIQSLAFKYIWDSSDETPEVDQTDDLDLNLDAFKVSTDFGSL